MIHKLIAAGDPASLQVAWDLALENGWALPDNWIPWIWSHRSASGASSTFESRSVSDSGRNLQSNSASGSFIKAWSAPYGSESDRTWWTTA